MSNSVVLVSVLALLAGAALSCSSEDTASTSPETKRAPTEPAAGEEPAESPSGSSEPAQPYTLAEVQALVDARCAGCHGERAAGGLDLRADVAAKTAGVASEQVPGMMLVEPGDRTKSYVFHKLAGTHTTVGGTGVTMPKGKAPLTAEELERFGRFIDAL